MVEEDNHSALHCFTKAGFTKRNDLPRLPSGYYHIIYGSIDKIMLADKEERTGSDSNDIGYDPYSYSPDPYSLDNPFLF